MRIENQGWIYALLFVLLVSLSGCARRGQIRMSGMTAGEALGQTESLPAAEPGEEDPVRTDAVPSPDAYVYVCGAVQRPGVYPMTEGMRVFEAIEAAGGFSEDADRLWLNQAESLADGQRVYVYSREETQALAQEQKDGATLRMQEDLQAADGGAQDGKVNLNTADCETLMTLPGIGRAKADAIVQYRQEHGAFASVAEIQNVPGIKDAVFSKIKDRITV